jgi:hypothetical protein
MRIWSLHPQHLDAKGLVALWRESLLAQKVLLGETKGYRNHPQLNRFKSHPDPLAAIGVYLLEVQLEAVRRGYQFNASKILCTDTKTRIRVTNGQVAYELAHLSAKLKVRDLACYARLVHDGSPAIHPLFKVVSGEIEDWEVV